MHRFVALALLLLSSCGTPPNPETPAVEPVPAEPAGEASGESAPPAAEQQAGPASAEEVSAVLQLVVNDEELDKFLHLNEPGRFPLKVSGDGLPSDLKVVKNTEPVKIVERPESKKEAVLVFTSIEIGEKQASVRFQYDVENIRGTAHLTKGPHGWELQTSRIVER
jgi:hypothetical protein